MSHAKNKVEWCLKKAEKEGINHRGLVKNEPNIDRAKQHIIKAEHYLRATGYLKKGNFSDISASTVFYSIYHCLLAIALKFGYESRNQECTFALMHFLVDDKKIDISHELLDKISLLNNEKNEGETSVEIREQYQYGTQLSLKEDLYEELFDLAQNVISKTKTIIEE